MKTLGLAFSFGSDAEFQFSLNQVVFFASKLQWCVCEKSTCTFLNEIFYFMSMKWLISLGSSNYFREINIDLDNCLSLL